MSDDAFEEAKESVMTNFAPGLQRLALSEAQDRCQELEREQQQERAMRIAAEEDSARWRQEAYRYQARTRVLEDRLARIREVLEGKV